ncbi:hypothetical protein E2C01_051591 [Portunus trituberculatus]|uniref:Uncharacterized protein n=1 Tax=Portunus trituberculatus TaxID=210409 RepID=A0A5B7GJ52_PORTR|nr:hypothetical protein [Portunus trituberculatus]
MLDPDFGSLDPSSVAGSLCLFHCTGYFLSFRVREVFVADIMVPFERSSSGMKTLGSHVMVGDSRRAIDGFVVRLGSGVVG